MALFFKSIKRFSKSNIQAILIQDFPQLGFEGEVVTVKPGYLERFLLPNKIAIYNFPPGIKNKLYPNINDEEIKQRKARLAEIATYRKRIENLSVEFYRNESFTNPSLLKDEIELKDILNEIKNKLEIEIDPKTVITEDQKFVKFGNYSIRVRDFYSENLNENLNFSIKVNLKRIVKEGKIGGKAKKENEKEKAAAQPAKEVEKEEGKKEKGKEGKGKKGKKEEKEEKKKK